MMPDMPPEPQHARPARERDTAIVAAWAVLIIAAVTSGTYNLVHAFEHSAGHPEIPFLFGAVPPVLAALLAHVAAAHRSSWWIKAAVIVVTVTSMSLSITAVASVAAPMGGKVMSVVFGLAVDAAAMTALVLILDNHRRRAVADSALEQASADAESARQQASEATGKASALEAELAAERTGREAELASARAELEAALNRIPQRPRKRNRTGGTPRVSTARNKPGTDDANIEAAAVVALDAEPGLTGADLARRLGVSEGYGRRLRRELARSVPGPESQ